MIYKPYDYQKKAYNYIMNTGSWGLFLDMGLGKTVITLTAIADLVPFYHKMLIISPLRVAQNTWSGEIQKWDHLQHLRLSKILGTPKQRKAALAADADIYIVNRENTEWLVENVKKWEFDFVVIDELSSFKNGRAIRFKLLKKVRPKIDKLIGLTGTPCANGYMGLWSQIFLLDGGERLGKYITHFRQKYFSPEKTNGSIVYSWKLNPGGSAQIIEKISDLCLSMSALDNLYMPKMVENYIKTDMDEKEKKMYNKLKQEMLLQFDSGDIDPQNAAGLINKLLQFANGAVYNEFGIAQWIHDKKLEALEDLIEAANEQPVLVYYAYKHDADRIISRFQTAKILKTEMDIKKWNAGEILVALAHPASIGHGLNLQAGGHIIVWYGLTWDLELYQQANCRLYRQGQQKTVIINHIITIETIDEKIIAALSQKDLSQKNLLLQLKEDLERDEN